MRIAMATLAAVASCGRLHFDGEEVLAVDAAITPPSLAEKLPCNTATALAATPGGLSLDSMTWLSDASGDWIIGVEHTASGAHPFRRHRVTEGTAGLQVADLGIAVESQDPWLPTYLPIAGGWLVGFVESTGAGGYVMRTGDGLSSPTPPIMGTRIADFTSGSRALAPLSGDFVLVGISGGTLGAQIIDASGAARGPIITLASGNLDQSSIVSTGAGLGVVWRETITGDCHLAVFDQNLALQHGPVTIDLVSCRRPQIAWIPATNRLAVVATDNNDPSVWYATWTDQLVAVEAPRKLADSATDAFITPSADGAWVTWISTSGGEAIRSIHVGATDTALSALGAVNNSHALTRVGTTTVSLWENAGRVLAARLCTE